LVRDLQRGSLIIYPTETVFGVGCSATDTGAVLALRSWKNTAADKPFLVLVSGMAMAEKVGAVFTSRALALAAKYWPGPLTMVLPLDSQSSLLTSGVTGGTKEIGVRVSSHPWVQGLFARFDQPLVSTSLNLAGGPPAVTLPATIPAPAAFRWIINTHSPLSGKPSTLVRATENGIQILRQGCLKIPEAG
jgi:L-threonylcarbamoyladenylate synthase